MKVRLPVVALCIVALLSGCGITSLHGSGEVDIETDGNKNEKELQKDEQA